LSRNPNPAKLAAMFRACFFLTLAFALATCACSRIPVLAHRYKVRGVITGIRAGESTVTIQHEAVTHYMPAMTMPFTLRQTNQLAGLGIGDPVTFQLHVTRSDSWIDHLRKAGPKVDVPPTAGMFRQVREVEPLQKGDALPEYHFTDQFGRPLSTSRFKGQALAIEFLFTRCPLPNFCPFLAANFQETQTKLLADKHAPSNWHLLTLSFDPEFDSPGVLRRYAQNHGCKPEHWSFATGDLMDITALGDQFGLVFAHGEGGISHNLRAVVVDASGRVARIFTGNQWTSDELAAELIKASNPPKATK